VARRFTQILTQAEYANATQNRRVTQVLVQAEYANATQNRRVAQILLMVEYSKPWTPPGRVQGPAVQIM
jgi:hypothetical protein